jgi:hypothetical protein
MVIVPPCFRGVVSRTIHIPSRRHLFANEKDENEISIMKWPLFEKSGAKTFASLSLWHCHQNGPV